MTVFDNIKNKNIDELADWFNEHFDFDEAPHWKWWAENYCDRCEPVTTGATNCFGRLIEYAYCELNGNCRCFKDMEKIPNGRQIIKMWLESEEKV